MVETRATIKDVAARCGMSTLTVSRVINDHPSIKQSTRERVEAAMRELNYEPNAAAQNVRRGASRTIGFLMPDFAHGVSAIVAQNVERVLHQAGYTVMLACSNFDPATEANALRAFERNRVEAVLLKTCDEAAPEIIERVRAMRCPVVLVDRDLDARIESVVIDHASAMANAVKYLVNMGHRDIALIAPSSKMRPGRERIAGFRTAMAEAGLQVHASRIVDGGHSDDYARQAIIGLMQSLEPPTALIAGGNQILLGAIGALKEIGVRYPDDISLLGADHPHLGRIMTPEITMIDRQPVLLAEATAKALLRMLADPAHNPGQTVIRSIFTTGASCAPPSKRRRRP